MKIPNTFGWWVSDCTVTVDAQTGYSRKVSVKCSESCPAGDRIGQACVKLSSVLCNAMFGEGSTCIAAMSRKRR